MAQAYRQSFLSCLRYVVDRRPLHMIYCVPPCPLLSVAALKELRGKSGMAGDLILVALLMLNFCSKLAILIV